MIGGNGSIITELVFAAKDAQEARSLLERAERRIKICEGVLTAPGVRVSVSFHLDRTTRLFWWVNEFVIEALSVFDDKPRYLEGTFLGSGSPTTLRNPPVDDTVAPEGIYLYVKADDQQRIYAVNVLNVDMERSHSWIPDPVSTS